MRVVSIVVLCLMFLLTMLSIHYRKAQLSEIVLKKTPDRILRPVFYRLGMWCYRDQVKKDQLIRQIYPLDNPDEIYVKKRLSLGRYLYYTIIGIALLAIVADVMIEPQPHIFDDQYIYRSADDGAYDHIPAIVSAEGLEDTEIMVGVRDYYLEGDALEALFAQTEAYVCKSMLGENQDIGEVRHKLNLMTEIPGNSMEIIWHLEDTLCIMSDGNLDTQKLSEQGEVQNISFTLIYGEEKRDYPISVKLFPPLKSEKEKYMEALQEAIDAGNDLSEKGDSFVLPSQVMGHTLVWKEKIPEVGKELVMFAVLALTLLGIYGSRTDQRELQKRKSQLAEDYPVFIHKLVLMSAAGMNMQMALSAMVNEQQLTHRKMRYVYQEAEVALKMMQQGVAEVKAYESFGKSCDSTMYLKLSSMMIQCVKRGASGMNDLMTEMAAEALMIRKDMVRQKAEKTSTRLLLPMGMILIVVFAILILPAFLSMNV